MSEFRRIEEAGVLVIEAMGRLDALASPQMEEMLQHSIVEGHTQLVVDLAQAVYVSSSCLRALLVGARLAREQGGDLKLCSLQPRVRRVFEIAGFDIVFALAESRAQAMASFAHPAGDSPPT